VGLPAGPIGARVDHLTVDLVDDLVHGAGLLAAGGSRPLIAMARLRDALVEHGPVPLVDADDLDAGALVVAADVLGDGLPGQDAVHSAVAAAERRAGRACAAVIPLGAGGVGALAAPYAAAVLGLPCVDGDGGRRGSGRLDLTLFALGGLAASPASASDQEGSLVTVDAADNGVAHRLLQAGVTGLSGPAMVSAYPMTAADCARTAAAGSLSRCAALGAMLRTLGDEPALAARLLATHATRLLFTGRITHVARNGPPGAVRGTATVETTSPPTRTMRVDFQRSNLVASEDGVVNATVPDLISLVDADTWVPAHTERMESGQLVHVLALAAHPRWHATAGIAVSGPRQYGYDIDYEPLDVPLDERDAVSTFGHLKGT